MIDAAKLDDIKQLLAQRTGLRIPAEAHDRFANVLHERTARLSLDTLEEYRTFLAGNKAAGEWEEFARLFSSAETFFFRDHGQFDLLRLRLLPELLARHSNDQTLRLWSAGCASGEEAYSLAMLVDMLLPEHRDWSVLILGTDIDSLAIARARHGRYGKWSFRMVPAALQQRYFHQEGNEWVLDERIRRMVTFRVVNLVDEMFPASGYEPDYGSELHDMDLILCRNVFIYFDSAAVSAIAAKFAATLAEGGYLMTAHTELIGHTVRGLESRLFAEGVVYRRHDVHLPANVAQPSVAVGAAKRSAPALSMQAIPGESVQRKEERCQEAHAFSQTRNPVIDLCALARTHADQGEYGLAEQVCREALTADPLAAAPYFLLAQLAQLKGDFEQAKECLNKAIYLDHRCVAAYLELAALHERAGDLLRAQALRHAALGIVRTMPDNEQIEQYERTAGELTQWLIQWEPSANNHGGADRSSQRGP